MPTPSSDPSVAALVGDAVASREQADQVAMMQSLTAMLHTVNEQVETLQPLGRTIGDEFQGAFRTLARAVAASGLIQLHSNVDVRCGIGWGSMERSGDELPFGQSGPAWWNAREALDAVAKIAETKSQPRASRTRVVGVEPGLQTYLNAFLSARDHIIGTMDSKDRAVTIGLLRGQTQHEIADNAGISQSEVARRAVEHGAYVLVSSHNAFIDVSRPAGGA